MNVNDQEILTILYNPIDYTHSSHLPVTCLPVSACNRMLLNDWLHINRNLSDLDNDQQDWYACSRTLLSNWKHMSFVAHLTGGFLLRGFLCGYTPLIFTDPLLSKFMSLPLKTRVSLPIENYTIHDTFRCGASFILEQFPMLPDAFKQRFVLIFPSEMELLTLNSSPGPDNSNLINMAINYANNIP